MNQKVYSVKKPFKWRGHWLDPKTAKPLLLLDCEAAQLVRTGKIELDAKATKALADAAAKAEAEAKAKAEAEAKAQATTRKEG